MTIRSNQQKYIGQNKIQKKICCILNVVMMDASSRKMRRMKRRKRRTRERRRRVRGLGTVGEVIKLGHLMTFQEQVPLHYSFICPQPYSENRFHSVPLQKQRKSSKYCMVL